jgi:hypothetical protein
MPLNNYADSCRTEQESILDIPRRELGVAVMALSYLRFAYQTGSSER